LEAAAVSVIARTSAAVAASVSVQVLVAAAASVTVQVLVAVRVSVARGSRLCLLLARILEVGAVSAADLASGTDPGLADDLTQICRPSAREQSLVAGLPIALASCRV
jgi:hypothetical protein